MKDRLISARKRTTLYITHNPFVSFLSLLGILFVLVIVGNILRRPAPAKPQATPTPRHVEVFRVGDSPRVRVQGIVEKTGIITVTAQTAGIVQEVYKTEGDQIGRRATIAWLSANYDGSSPADVSRQIADRNAQYSNESYDAQKDAVSKQRSIVDDQHTQAQDLRDITRQSLGDTGNLISLTQTVINKLDTQIQQLQASNNGGVNDASILAIQQQEVGLKSQLNQLSASYHQNDYNSKDDTKPREIQDLTHELTLRQLEVQDKSIDLARDVANLNARLSAVAQQIYYPATPCDGVVERVYVRVGQTVQPGAKIATIRANGGATIVTAMVNQEVASKYIQTEPSILHLNDGTSASIDPVYVPSDATDGTLSAISYDIPSELAAHMTNKSYVSVEIPLGTRATVGDSIYVPLDSIYQSDEASYVFVARRDKTKKYLAHTAAIQLGTVSGSYVQVTRGISPGDVVLLDRQVADGDPVAF